MTSIYLVRHGETAWNAEGRFQGQSDTPLNEKGKQQANALGQHFKGKSLTAIYTSDLQRAWETARIIGSYHTLAIMKHSGLREMSFGSWEGMDYDQIQDRYPDELASWQNNILNTSPPGGENLEQLAVRVQVVYDHICQKHKNDTLLVVAHGGVIQVMLCMALELSPHEYWHFHIDPGSLSEIAIYPEGIILNRLNITFDE